MIEPDEVKHAKALAGGGRARFMRVLSAAVLGLDRGIVVEAAYPRVAMVRTTDDRLGVVIVEPGGPDDEALAADIARFLAKWTAKEIALLVIGPEATGRAFAQAATPPKRKRVEVGGAAPAGAVWGTVPEGPLGEALAGRGPEPDVGALEMALKSSEQALAERRGFAARLAAQLPYVTYTLVAVNVAFFLVQSYLGGGLDPSVALLVRMGGVSSELIARGEPWRLVSSAFLHGGVMHLAFNMLVLIIIGRLVERVLGPQRFLMLYTACALAGAGASALVMDAPVSVGASGALWGVLAAEAVLAFAPGFLPAVMVPMARRAAVINLGLNIVNSFRPHVDWAAHFGGGLAGAALLWLVLSRGIPRGERLATDAPTPLPGMNAIAIGCALLLGAGALAGPLLGGALSYGDAVRFERVEIAVVGATVEVPADRGVEAHETDEGAVSVTFGELGMDRAILSLTRIEVAPEDRGGEEALVADALETAIDGLTRARAPRVVERDGRTLHAAGYTLRNGVVLDRVLLAGEGWIARVDAYYLPSDASYASEIAERAAASWRPTR